MKGWILPFLPMRPPNGPSLTKKLALEILEKMEDHRYVYQPKLNGDRVILAIHQRASSRPAATTTVLVPDRNAGDFKPSWRRHRPGWARSTRQLLPVRCLALERPQL